MLLPILMAQDVVSVWAFRKDFDRRTLLLTVPGATVGIFAGWWLAVGHLCSALACFVTIIGIPFGIQHIKLALIALAPIGKTIVSK